MIIGLLFVCWNKNELSVSRISCFMFVHSNVLFIHILFDNFPDEFVDSSSNSSDSRTYTNPRETISGPAAIRFCFRFNVTTTVKMPSCDKSLRSRRTILPTSPTPIPSIRILPAWTRPLIRILLFLYSTMSPLSAMKTSVIFAVRLPAPILSGQ